MIRPITLALSAAACWLCAGCATLTDSTEQTVLVQTILDNREVAGVGCVLTNKAGRWYVLSPGRVKVTRNAGPLAVDCKKAAATGYDVVASKLSTSGLWGNIVVSAGLGYYVDKNTGAGYDYPATLTILMHSNAAPAAPKDEPAAGGTAIY
ncbi:MAG TPA: hypothetical protein VFF16_08770 [Telluria sp.]|nr:hypothetical protein [Telluria sp.]